MKLNKVWNIALLIALMAAFTACDDDNESSNTIGKVNISITDAPVDDANISAVVISISSIEAKGPDGWKTVKAFDEPVSVNLLNYQNGESFLLTENEMQAGSYSEVRLILNMQEKIDGELQNPNSYLEYKDGSKEPLFVPSGSQSGYKAKGDFTIPADGVVSITVDFDLRKALVKAGESGKYLLKPIIRLVANQNAGLVRGNFGQADAYNKVIVFAYADGDFDESEINEPVDGEVRFSNSISSSLVNEDESFTLAFMDGGHYDLYFAVFDAQGTYVDLLGSYQDVSIESGTEVELEISLDLLN